MKEEEAEEKETEMSSPSAEKQTRGSEQNLRTDSVLSEKKLLATAAAGFLASDTGTLLLPLASAKFLSLCWVRKGVALFSVGAPEGAGAAGYWQNMVVAESPDGPGSPEARQTRGPASPRTKTGHNGVCLATMVEKLGGSSWKEYL